MHHDAVQQFSEETRFILVSEDHHEDDEFYYFIFLGYNMYRNT